LIFKGSNSFCQDPNAYYYKFENKILLKQADSLFTASNYEASIKVYKELLENYRKSDEWADYLKINLQIVQAYQIKGVFDSSFYFLKVSNEVINKYKIVNGNLLGTYYYFKGTTYSKTGEMDSSLQSLNLSMKFFNGGVNDSLLVLVKRSIGNINFSVGKLDLALEFYKDALSIEISRSRPSEIMMAALFQNIGIVFTVTGNYDSARVYLNRSIILKEKTLAKTDPQLAIGYLNYGRFLYLTGYPDQALQYYTQAEEIYNSTFGKDYFGLAPIYYNKGSIFILLRDLNKALNYHERALELYLSRSNQNNSIIGELYMNLGVIYEQMGDFNKAIIYYNESLMGNYNSESVVKSLRSLGRCYYVLKDNAKAEKNFLMSIDKSENFFGPNHPNTAGSYLAFGEFCISINEYKKAEEFLVKAYNIWVENFGNRNREVSLTLTYLGNLYRKMGDLDKALVYYQKAIISNTESFSNENVYNNPSLNDLDPEFNEFVTLYKKAYTLYDIYLEKSKSIHDLEISLETSKLAIGLFELILASYKDESTKLAINEYVYDIYNLVVLIATDLYSKSKDPRFEEIAFEYSEKGKAAILLSSIRGLEAIEFADIPSGIRQKEEELNRDIALLKNFIYDENQKSSADSLKLETWRKSIFNKTVSYDSLIKTIENDYPQYYNFKYNFDVVKTSDIQTKLSKGELLVEYKMIDSLLLTFFITPDSIRFHSDVLDADFKDKVLTFVSSINQFPTESFNKEDFIEFIYLGNYLYRTLFTPEDVSAKYSRVIIIPDNVLGYLPFEALLKEYSVPDRIDFSKLEYLLKSYPLSYSFSSTLLFKYSDRKKYAQNILAMAPDYSKSLNQTAESLSRTDKIYSNLNPLIHSKDEVNNIISIMKGKVFLGDDATELNFKKNAEKYGILHFAMHTLIDDENPMASKLIFTLNNDSTEDGFLNAYEIYNLKLNAKLAVLSACKTGTGKLDKGEGIMSLARGFLFAGIPSVVMTMWEVEDVAGAEIMTDFYKQLKTGIGTDMALRNAKLTYLEQSDPLQSHPYFWAAYVQIGKTTPVTNKPEITIAAYAGISLMLAAILFLFIRYRFRKKL
jgi:tetratricopeptide (TPR) repeat protein